MCYGLIKHVFFKYIYPRVLSWNLTCKREQQLRRHTFAPTLTTLALRCNCCLLFQPCHLVFQEPRGPEKGWRTLRDNPGAYGVCIHGDREGTEEKKKKNCHTDSTIFLRGWFSAIWKKRWRHVGMCTYVDCWVRKANIPKTTINKHWLQLFRRFG